MTVGNIDLVDLLFTFQGRINRGKYWLGVLIFIILSVLLFVLGFILGMVGLTIIATIVAIVVYIGMIVAGIALGIKRLHDRGKTGWWLLVFMFAPGILSGIGLVFGDTLALVFSLASLAIAIWAFVELGCLKGDTGPNAYGPDPLMTPA